MSPSGPDRASRRGCIQCSREFTADLRVCPHDGTILTPFVQDDLVGTVLADRYEILEVIGGGGMGLVYKARHRLMNRIVAIKMLHKHMVSSADALKRFQVEAQAASCLSLPNILTIYDFGLSNEGQPFMVMDYLEGCSLGDVIEREGYLTVPRALDIFLQVCTGLAHAHSKGIIHRDLKPSNIMLVNSGEQRDFVKIVDFGIAKLMRQTDRTPEQLTRTGEVFGSPLYMSPEQCKGKQLDPRSDIYSLGSVMYRALTGCPIFEGDEVIEFLFKQVSEMPQSFGTVAPKLAIPKSLEQSVFKALAKEPENRWQTMEDLKHALEDTKIEIGGVVLRPTSAQNMTHQPSSNLGFPNDGMAFGDEKTRPTLPRIAQLSPTQPGLPQGQLPPGTVQPSPFATNPRNPAQDPSLMRAQGFPGGQAPTGEQGLPPNYQQPPPGFGTPSGFQQGPPPAYAPPPSGFQAPPAAAPPNFQAQPAAPPAAQPGAPKPDYQPPFGSPASQPGSQQPPFAQGPQPGYQQSPYAQGPQPGYQPPPSTQGPPPGYQPPAPSAQPAHPSYQIPPPTPPQPPVHQLPPSPPSVQQPTYASPPAGFAPPSGFAPPTSQPPPAMGAAPPSVRESQTSAAMPSHYPTPPGGFGTTSYQATAAEIASSLPPTSHKARPTFESSRKTSEAPEVPLPPQTEEQVREAAAESGLRKTGLIIGFVAAIVILCGGSLAYLKMNQSHEEEHPASEGLSLPAQDTRTPVPVRTPILNINKPTPTTPVTTAVTSVTKPSLPTANTATVSKPAPTATTSSATTVTSAITKPAPTAITKPAATAITKPAPTAITKPTATAITKPTATAVTKPAPTAVTKPAPTATTKPAPTATTKPAPTATTKPAPAAITKPAPAAITKPAPTATTKPAPAKPSAPAAKPSAAAAPTHAQPHAQAPSAPEHKAEAKPKQKAQQPTAAKPKPKTTAAAAKQHKAPAQSAPPPVQQVVAPAPAPAPANSAPAHRHAYSTSGY
jgi:eukaryotic-like serine/threonine-protein kinase